MFPKFWNKYTDKVLHFCAGGIIYLIAFGIFKILWLAYLLVAIAAILKEAKDAAKTLEWQRFDLYDIAATLAGGVAVSIAFKLIGG